MTKQIKAMEAMMEYIDLSKYFHNVTEALDNYRALTAFCESALEGVVWEIQGVEVPTWLMRNAEQKFTTVTIKAHIDQELERYKAVCELRGETRKYNIIESKYIRMPEACESKKPYTNEQLSDFFDCSIDTIQREIRQAKKELKVFLFGVDKI